METGENLEEKWANIINGTRQLVLEDETFTDLPSKDKLLTFYYYHFDEVLDHRPFIVNRILSILNPLQLHHEMRRYKTVFRNLVDPIVSEALDEDSLKSIPIFDRGYYDFFWMQHLFVLRFWTTDESRDFENTFALIEKTMKSTFDFMGKGELKSSIDFWKFVFQNPIKMRWNDG